MTVLRCARCHRQASIQHPEDAERTRWRVWADGSSVCKPCLDEPAPPPNAPPVQLSAARSRPVSFPASDLRNPRHAEFYALQRAHDDPR